MWACGNLLDGERGGSTTQAGDDRLEQGGTRCTWKVNYLLFSKKETYIMKKHHIFLGNKWCLEISWLLVPQQSPMYVFCVFMYVFTCLPLPRCSCSYTHLYGERNVAGPAVINNNCILWQVPHIKESNSTKKSNLTLLVPFPPLLKYNIIFCAHRKPLSLILIPIGKTWDILMIS